MQNTLILSNMQNLWFILHFVQGHGLILRYALNFLSANDVLILKLRTLSALFNLMMAPHNVLDAGSIIYGKECISGSKSC